MKYILLLIFIVGVVGCGWRHYTKDTKKDKRYRELIKTKDFQVIPEDEIPNNSMLVLEGVEGLIHKKTDSVIGRQWYDFKDGSEPGVYYIYVPTVWELRRYEREKKMIQRKYGAKFMTTSQLDSLLKDTTNKHFILF